LSVSPDFLIKPVGIEIGPIGPGNDTKLKSDLMGKSGVGKRGKYSSIVAGNKSRHVRDTAGAIDKGNGKPISGLDADGGNPPRRGRNYSRGAIRFGDCLD